MLQACEGLMFNTSLTVIVPIIGTSFKASIYWFLHDGNIDSPHCLNVAKEWYPWTSLVLNVLLLFMSCGSVIISCAALPWQKFDWKIHSCWTNLRIRSCKIWHNYVVEINGQKYRIIEKNFPVLNITATGGIMDAKTEGLCITFYLIYLS